VPRELQLAVIDDDGSFRAALVESLCSLGYGAREFASAEAFMAADGIASYDCVITDIHMPGMSGLDLMRSLRARGSSVAIIVITARAEPAMEERALAGGAIGLLRKPFGTDDLVGCLEKACGV